MEFTEMIPPTLDSEALESLPPLKFGDESTSDVVLIVDQQEFFVHKEILAARSPVFDIMFHGNFREANEGRITIKATDPVTFKRFLELFYYEEIIDGYKFLSYGDNGVPLPESNVYISKCRQHANNWTYNCDAKFLRGFWNSITPLLEISDRYNVIDLLKRYLNKGVIADDILMHTSCAICMNAFIFAAEQHLNISKEAKLFDQEAFGRYLFYMMSPNHIYRSVIDYNYLRHLVNRYR